jgi:hypothetical protein
MRIEEIELPSNRKFGLLFAIIFVLIAGRYALKAQFLSAWIFSILFLITIIITGIKPELLLPLNKLWMRFGFLLGKIVSPIVLGIIFFFLFSPIAFLMRITGRDELCLKKTIKLSFWKNRTPIGPDFSSFKQQF